MISPKPVIFLATALEDLRAFPDEARRDSGYQIDRVQHGREPADWKPMPSIGPGVREIRVRESSGAYRVIYLAKMGSAVYVLHCFRKTTQKTSPLDHELAKKRYRDLMRSIER